MPLNSLHGGYSAVLIRSGLPDMDYFSDRLVSLWLWRQIVLQRREARLASRLVSRSVSDSPGKRGVECACFSSGFTGTGVGFS